MGKRIFVAIIFLVFLVTFGSSINASTLNPPETSVVDLGSVQVVELIHKIQGLSLPVPPSNPTKIQINTSGLMNTRNTQRIEPERITVILNNQPAALSGTPVTMDLGGMVAGSPIDAKFDLELRPEDGPGSYEGLIGFSFGDGNIWSEPVQITMKVTLEAWIHLKTSFTMLMLEPDPLQNDKNLKVSGSLLLQLAANFDWQLSLQCTPVDLPLRFVVNAASSQQYQGAGPVSISPADGPTVIAAGPATVSETKFWLDIPITIRLSNYTQYPAGLYDFSVSFTGAILNLP